MANLCSNNITIRCSKATIETLLQQCKDYHQSDPDYWYLPHPDEGRHFCFQAFIPCPSELKFNLHATHQLGDRTFEYWMPYTERDEQKVYSEEKRPLWAKLFKKKNTLTLPFIELPLRGKFQPLSEVEINDLQMKFGHITTEEWTEEHWGVSEISEPSIYKHSTSCLSIVGDTRWAQPSLFCKKLSIMYPDSSIELHFCEMGSVMCGSEFYHNGELVRSCDMIAQCSDTESPDKFEDGDSMDGLPEDIKNFLAEHGMHSGA